MSFKRSRAAYEADLGAEQSSFVAFGTPLPPLDAEVRDDGSYVPVWKQDVRDEKGRRRLHGAFTGGWSAGYFNTVGSKEGWTPSTFVSSRTNRRKDDQDRSRQRAEDYMDEEDLADAAEAQKIQTSKAFAGLGFTDHEIARDTGLAGLFRVEGETMGKKLLRRMGWKEGQGIGPKVRRAARLDVGHSSKLPDTEKTHLFAPENVAMVAFDRKLDHKGLGCDKEARMAPLKKPGSRERSAWSDEESESEGEERSSKPLAALIPKKNGQGKQPGGIGMGVLNDTGSDDEDPYEIGPRISYNRVIGGDKKKKKNKDAVSNTFVNPSLRSKPTFISPRTNLARVALGVRKCHDGRLPLEGFIFGQKPDDLIAGITASGQYPPPQIPPGWKSAKQPSAPSAQAAYVSTADAARASALDPKLRAAALGEQQLPGKSVFDFLSPAARDRIAAVTGKTNLPPALGEIPEAYTMTDNEKMAELLKDVPQLDKETAVAALTRGASGGGPYGDDEAKRSRYRAYLENQAGFGRPLPTKSPNMSTNDWLHELHEFYNCARIFKPMTGLMASRFTTSSSASKLGTPSDGQGETRNLVSKPAPKACDPGEDAAKLGMYGQMTRSIQDFYPTRLLCKRFNVKLPDHVQPDDAGNMSSKTSYPGSSFAGFPPGDTYPQGIGMLQSTPGVEAPTAAKAAETIDRERVGTRERPQVKEDDVLDTSRNEALEGERAGEEVFKAIFGDDSEEE